MGCCFGSPKVSSRKFVPRENIPGQGKKDLDKMMMVGFTQNEINKLYGCFCSIDVTDDNQLEYAEVLVYMKLDDNPITKEIFSECDLGKTGTITFAEFVLSLWLFCSRQRDGLVEFAFEVFDSDDSGVLQDKEIYTMLGCVYGLSSIGGWASGSQGKTNKQDEHIKTLMKQMDKSRDGEISKKEFIAAVRKFPKLLSPVFDVYSQFCDAFGGESFWESHRHERTAKLKDRRVSSVLRSVRHRKNQPSSSPNERERQNDDSDKRNKTKPKAKQSEHGHKTKKKGH